MSTKADRIEHYRRCAAAAREQSQRAADDTIKRRFDQIAKEWQALADALEKARQF